MRAKRSGADAIKLKPISLKKKKYKKIFNILKKCELKFNEFKLIKDYCKSKKINFFSTPFDKESVQYLNHINVNLFKIASFDIGNYDLINEILKTRKPTIVSTGMAKLKEIDKIYKLFKLKKVKIKIFHCVSSYPNKDVSSYLSNIGFLKKRYNTEIGISDHTNDINIPIYGKLLGANIIEKHLKIDKHHKCVDAPVSITGDQFKELKKEIDKIDIIFGKIYFGFRKEEKNLKKFKRSRIL